MEDKDFKIRIKDENGKVIQHILSDWNCYALWLSCNKRGHVMEVKNKAGEWEPYRAVKGEEDE